MKTSYRITFKGTLTINKSVPVVGGQRVAPAAPDSFTYEGELGREDETGLSSDEHVQLGCFSALAPVIPTDGSEDYKGVMDAVKTASGSILEVLAAVKKSAPSSAAD